VTHNRVLLTFRFNTKTRNSMTHNTLFINNLNTLSAIISLFKLHLVCKKWALRYVNRRMAH